MIHHIQSNEASNDTNKQQSAFDSHKNKAPNQRQQRICIVFDFQILPAICAVLFTAALALPILVRTIRTSPNLSTQLTALETFRNFQPSTASTWPRCGSVASVVTLTSCTSYCTCTVAHSPPLPLQSTDICTNLGKWSSLMPTLTLP